MLTVEDSLGTTDSPIRLTNAKEKSAGDHSPSFGIWQRMRLESVGLAAFGVE